MTGTEITVPPPAPGRIPMPIYHGNAELSFLAVMLFPDDLILARKCVAGMLLFCGTPQNVLGIRLNNEYLAAIRDEYLTAILDDVIGAPDKREVKKRLYWSSAVGQIIKVLFTLVKDGDPQVRSAASLKQAIEQVEMVDHKRTRKRDKHERATRSGFQTHLKCFQRALHMCAAFEMARDARDGGPRTIDGLMLDAMKVHEILFSWHASRYFSGNRASYLDSEVFWKWPGMSWDDSHGLPLLRISFDKLAPRGRVGRPPKYKRQREVKNVLYLFFSRLFKGLLDGRRLAYRERKEPSDGPKDKPLARSGTRGQRCPPKKSPDKRGRGSRDHRAAG